jgi:negative regulator of flagellin synthesis FlgM
MIINGNGPIDDRKQLGNVQDMNKKRDVDKQVDTQKAGSSSDKVSLSEQAREISELKGLIGEIPDIRRDKVEDVQKALDTGTYNLDSLKIAQKILEEEI